MSETAGAGVEPAARTGTTPIVRACAEFLDHMAVERGLSRNTLDSYRRDLEAYAGFLAERGISSADDVARSDVEDFIAARREAGRTPRSTARCRR